MNREQSKENPTDSLDVTPDLIAESFAVSSGSLFAHELFLSAVAQKHNLSTLVIQEKFNRAVADLDIDGIRTIGSRMSRYHNGNKSAVEDVKKSVRGTDDKSFLQALQENLPNETISLRLSFMLYNDKISSVALNNALADALNIQNSTLRIETFRSICAYLGHYGNQNWWKELSLSTKQQMIDHGAKLYEASLSKNLTKID
jgi:hypothetical protein